MALRGRHRPRLPTETPDPFRSPAIPQGVLTRYPGLFTRADFDALPNLRGVLLAINREFHLSFLAKAWNKFYRTYPNATRDMIEHYVNMLDRLFGAIFLSDLYQ